MQESRIPNKKLGYGLLGLLLIYVVLRSIAAAAGKSFWYDEVLTAAVSSLGSWKARMTALMLPLDGQPPLFYTIEHFAAGLTRNQEIALRVPSIAALVCTLVCIFVYVKERGGEVVGLLSATVILTTTLFQTYAVEARPYSMVIACVAFALVCYQRAPSAGWMALLGISLALAESLHYLAVLAMIPLGLAEATVFLMERRIRWLVWVALAVGVVPLVQQWELLAINKAYYGPHFWAHFSFTNLPQTYGDFFSANSPIGGGIAGLVLAALVGAYFWPSAHEQDGRKDTATTVEAVLLVAFVALPFLAYVLISVVMHSALTMRYVLLTVVGIALAIGFALSRATWRATALLAVFLLGAIAVQELSFWRSIRLHIHETTTNATEVENFVKSAGYQELPIAVANPLVYLPLVRSCVSVFGDRLFFIVPEAEGNISLPDTAAKGIALLQSYWPVQTRDFREFTSKHKEFLIYIEEAGVGRDWLAVRLVQEGWWLRPLGYDNYRILYLAKRGRSSGP